MDNEILISGLRQGWNALFTTSRGKEVKNTSFKLASPWQSGHRTPRPDPRHRQRIEKYYVS